MKKERNLKEYLGGVFYEKIFKCHWNFCSVIYLHQPIPIHSIHICMDLFSIAVSSPFLIPAMINIIEDSINIYGINLFFFIYFFS